MPKFTVVISDRSEHDAGYRKNRVYWWLASKIGGYGELCLYWFLREYFGAGSVQLIRPSELLDRVTPLVTDYLMVGVPTRLNQQHMLGVKCTRVILYDSSDHHGINFLYSDEKFLLTLTDCCLKHYRDRRWQLPMRIGLLPVKRPPINRLHRKLKTRGGSTVLQLSQRPYDVGFVARPTGDVRENIRCRWWIELVENAPELRRWGGLVGREKWRKEFPEASVPDACWMKRKKVRFSEYFDGLLHSKVALAPAGYAPWTFRHYEAIYAGCMLVTEDLSPFEFLVPIPEQSRVQVGEDESLTEGVRRAIQLGEGEPSRLLEAREELDRWMSLGRYSQRCSHTLERFMEGLSE